MEHPDDSSTGESQGGAVIESRSTAGKRGSLGSCGFQNRHSVLVCSGRWYKYHRLRDLYTIGNYCLEFWRLRRPRSRYWQWLVRVYFLADRQPSFHSLHNSTSGEGLFGVSIIRVLISFMRTPLSWTKHLPYAPSLNCITLGVRISTLAFERDTII